MSGRFDEVYRRSLADPQGFWGEAAEEIHWDRPWERVLDDRREPIYRWFSGGRLNTCYNALDVHADGGRGDQPALVYDSPVTGTVKSYTFRELRDEVALFAGALAARGVGRGDRVVIYMPMVPEAAIAMLACARLGALGGLRRLRPPRAGGADRRRAAEGHRLGLLRHRGPAGDPLQAAPRRGDRARPPQARRDDHPEAAAGRGRDDRRARRRGWCATTAATRWP